MVCCIAVSVNLIFISDIFATVQVECSEKRVETNNDNKIESFRVIEIQCTKVDD